MNILMIILLVGAALVIVCYVFFPRNTFVSFDLAKAGILNFSRRGASIDAPPDRYAVNGFDHIETYVSRLLAPTGHFKSLGLFTADGHRGFGLNAKDGIVQATLTVELQREADKVTAIRSFFESTGIKPSQDYLAENGGIPNAIRILEYPMKGNTDEVTYLSKRILSELYKISPTEGLNISYKVK